MKANLLKIDADAV